ncbi:Retrovirus-related Pol polyprotein from transposon TNT 1-94 [Dendrobium catenatum]|uniref:Retrovirus-related Pol polyprotein from transposon TNT 1-94 n=1 Tax=Dendrobium catenatum TaxID=906689 RepID=A0A2I0X3T1_9ASPA|nr:Retrovirus-related Pol polyprotein from transposon TNT 1-94 [Dendrobium catenatum]
MQNKTMTEYLASVKVLVDNINAAGGSVDSEDVLHYILNGLPPNYQSFKTFIRSSLQPISLDNLYSLLRSEEVHQTTDAVKDLSFSSTAAPADSTLALFTNRGRGRGRFNSSRGRGRNSGASRPPRAPRFDGHCQICGKVGHSAVTCWHRGNFQYTSPAPSNDVALLANNSTADTNSWYLDSGATAHLSPDLLPFQQPYTGKDHVLVGNGNSVPIQHLGDGLLPTPTRKLLLKPLLHVPNLTHRLLSISKLITDNHCSITFD